MRTAQLKVLVVVVICIFLGWMIGAYLTMAGGRVAKPPAPSSVGLLVSLVILMGWGILGPLAKRRTGTARWLMTFVLILSGIPVGLLITGFSLQYGFLTPGAYAMRLIPITQSGSFGDRMLLDLGVASVGNAICLTAICHALDWVFVGTATPKSQDDDQASDAHN